MQLDQTPFRVLSCFSDPSVCLILLWFLLKRLVFLITHFWHSKLSLTLTKLLPIPVNYYNIIYLSQTL